MMNDSLKEEKTIDHALQRLRGFIYGNWQTSITCAFAELGIADQLQESPKTVAQLADLTKTQPSALTRFLRCASQLGFVRGGQLETYALTDFGQLLCSDHPFSQRAAARLNGALFRYQPWGHLVDILREGPGKHFSPTFEHGSLHYLADKPEQLQVFHQAMTDLSADENSVIAQAYDFSEFHHVIDIGCGQGTFLHTVLKANPHLSGTLFDLKCTSSCGSLQDSDTDHRLQRLDGDFFTAVPEQGDLYVLKNVIHNWPAAQALQLLRTVRAAMASSPSPHKRLLIIEHLIPEDDSFSLATWLDVNFMILVNGAEQNLDGYQALARQAGFTITRVILTSSGRSIMELALSLLDVKTSQALPSTPPG